MAAAELLPSTTADSVLTMVELALAVLATAAAVAEEEEGGGAEAFFFLFPVEEGRTRGRFLLVPFLAVVPP